MNRRQVFALQAGVTAIASDLKHGRGTVGEALAALDSAIGDAKRGALDPPDKGQSLEEVNRPDKSAPTSLEIDLFTALSVALVRLDARLATVEKQFGLAKA